MAAPLASAPVAVKLSVARNRLAALWLGLSGVLFLLLIAMTVMGRFENRAQDFWAWALPTVMPTLTLVVSVLGVDALKGEESEQLVNRGFLRLALLLSAFYLLLVLSTLFIEPLTSIMPLEMLKLSQLWLGPLQGLVTAAVGLVFFSKRPA